MDGKCPCCGSRQFVSHQSRRICAYCRSEQDGQAVPVGKPHYEFNKTTELLKEITGMYDAQFGVPIRPEVAIRIPKL